jgi:hypothetical protein
MPGAGIPRNSPCGLKQRGLLFPPLAMWRGRSRKGGKTPKRMSFNMQDGLMVAKTIKYFCQ